VPDAVTQMQDHLARRPSLALLDGRLCVVVSDGRYADAAHPPAGSLQIELRVFAYFPCLLSGRGPRRVGIDTQPHPQCEYGANEKCRSATDRNRLTEATAGDIDYPLGDTRGDRLSAQRDAKLSGVWRPIPHQSQPPSGDGGIRVSPCTSGTSIATSSRKHHDHSSPGSSERMIG
jgi:hypothetical protein